MIKRLLRIALAAAAFLPVAAAPAVNNVGTLRAWNSTPDQSFGQETSVPLAEASRDLDNSMGQEGIVVTVTWDEDNGITAMTTSIKFASKEDRDAALSTGVTDDMEMSYQLLDGILAA